MPDVKIKDIVMVEVSKLVPHPKNPNKHPENQIRRLADIIEFQGWRYPIKISKLSGFVTSGHGRIEAARLRGWTEVPVSYQDYENEAQEYADLVADNAVQEWSEMDLSAINIDIGDFGPELDIDMLGFKDFKVDRAEKEDVEFEAMAKSIFEVVVQCDSEVMQEKIYNDLTAEGLKCRVLTM